MLILFAISLICFLAATGFCHQQGLFDGGSMGVGMLFAFAIYVAFWILPTALAGICYAVWG